MSSDGSEITECPQDGRTHVVGPEPHVLMDGPVHEAFPEHVCPPTTLPEMLARLNELEKGFTERLANQRQVIENLSQARQTLLAANAEFESFVRYVAHDFTGDYALSERAMEVLNTSETP